MYFWHVKRHNICFLIIYLIYRDCLITLYWNKIIKVVTADICSISIGENIELSAWFKNGAVSKLESWPSCLVVVSGSFGIINRIYTDGLGNIGIYTSPQSGWYPGLGPCAGICLGYSMSFWVFWIITIVLKGACARKKDCYYSEQPNKRIEYPI